MTNLQKCHVYIPRKLDTYLSRSNDGVWLLDHQQVQVMRLMNEELTDIYEAVDKFAEDRLAYDINKMMLS